MRKTREGEARAADRGPRRGAAPGHADNATRQKVAPGSSAARARGLAASPLGPQLPARKQFSAASTCPAMDSLPGTWLSSSHSVTAEQCLRRRDAPTTEGFQVRWSSLHRAPYGTTGGVSLGSVGKGVRLSSSVMSWVTSDQPFHSSGPVSSPTTFLESLPTLPAGLSPLPDFPSQGRVMH